MRLLTENVLVLASHNRGKITELHELLGNDGISVLAAPDLDLEVPEETEETFAGNARIKARSAAFQTGFPALSDDSGIEVDALDGRPGVRTADWAETPDGRDFLLAMRRTWNMLERIRAPEPRTAQFRCTICVAWPDGHDILFEGAVRGHVIWPIRGTNGFGYDPMFLPLGKTRTFGEMDPKEKHRMSHRTRAFELFAAGCLRGRR